MHANLPICLRFCFRLRHRRSGHWYRQGFRARFHSISFHFRFRFRFIRDRRGFGLAAIQSLGQLTKRLLRLQPPLNKCLN